MPRQKSGMPNQNPYIDFVNQLAIRLLRRNTLSDLCWEIAEAIGELPGFADSILYLRKNDDLIQASAYGPKRGHGRQIVNPIQITIGHGIVGAAAMSGVVELVNDTQQDARYIHDEFNGRSELAVPVIYHDTVIAVLDTEHRDVGAYTQNHVELLMTIANISASRIASAIAEEDNRTVRDQLAELNQRLEQRVVQRTHDLSQARDIILKERDRWLAVLNSLQNGLLVVSSEFRIELASLSARELIGWNQQDAVGQEVGTVFRLKDVDNLPRFLAQLSEPLSAQDAVLLCNDGRQRSIRWNATPIQYEQSSESEFAIVFYDITQEKYLTQRTKNFDRIQSLGILAGGIAHDFNNNLAAIQASIDCVTSVDDPTEIRAINIARQACVEARQLTQQLLAFSKGGVPVRKPHRIEEILKTSAALSSSGRRLGINWQVSMNLPLVLVDPGQMTQVFNNIILNAVQSALPQTEPTVTITVDAVSSAEAEQYPGKPNLEAEHSLIRVVISDDGPGFAPGILGRVFEPYFSASTNGSGLGLTSSFFIVRNHQGDISVANSTDGGAKVTVLIPGIATNPPTPPMPALNTSKQQYRVLLLDDEDLVRDSIAMLLKSLGHDVVETSHGDETLAKVCEEKLNSSTRCQVALLDLTMRHGRGGAEVVQELKQLLPVIICVAISGYSDCPVMAQPQKFGFHAVLTKPFSRKELEELFATVAACFPG